MTTAFIYSEKFQDYDYGPSHPLKMLRLKLTHELLKACGTFEAEAVQKIEAEPCTREEAQWVHSAEYLDVLKGIDEGRLPENPAYWGLGYGDNPAFKGVMPARCSPPARHSRPRGWCRRRGGCGV